MSRPSFSQHPVGAVPSAGLWNVAASTGALQILTLLCTVAKCTQPLPRKRWSSIMRRSPPRVYTQYMRLSMRESLTQTIPCLPEVRNKKVAGAMAKLTCTWHSMGESRYFQALAAIVPTPGSSAYVPGSYHDMFICGPCTQAMRANSLELRSASQALAKLCKIVHLGSSLPACRHVAT